MKKSYITVYEVTRHYGGPEEGGWWYNWYIANKSVRIPKKFQGNTKQALRYQSNMVAKLQQEHEHLAWGNIYNANGGLLIDVITETVRQENKSTQRPIYC